MSTYYRVVQMERYYFVQMVDGEHQVIVSRRYVKFAPAQKECERLNDAERA